jgi:SAM-dependent methyltransferase
MYASEEKHWWYVGMRRITERIMDRALARRNNLQILDAGCGTGKNLELLGRYGIVTGIDFSEEAITFLRQRGSTRVLRSSVEALPFPDASFDVVTSFDVLCHRSIHDPQQVVDEFRRVLRPGGVLFLRLPAFEWLRGRHDVAVHTARRFTAPQVANALVTSGFEAQNSSYANSALLPVAIVRRLVDRWLGARGDDLTLPPAPINWLMGLILSAEAPFVSRGALPAGVTVVALGTLPGATSLDGSRD